ncbi:MAG: hypothetical protein KGO96_10575 [Elusimicrobia bacterium]|nr:hypothetical protein [Elusimicrobiota bacterium]
MEDTSSSSTDQGGIDFLTKRILNRRYMIRPVQVVKAPYNSSGSIPPGTPGPIGVVDILPLVNQMDGWKNAIPHGTVYGVNYLRLAGGGNAVINDPVQNDIGLALVSDTDWTTVRSTLAQANPASRRRSNMADAIYIGKIADGGTPEQYVSFTSSGITMKDKSSAEMVTSGGNVTWTLPGNFVVNGATITSAGEIVLKDGTIVDTHTHDDPQGGQVGPPHN